MGSPSLLLPLALLLALLSVLVVDGQSANACSFSSLSAQGLAPNLIVSRHNRCSRHCMTHSTRVDTSDARCSTSITSPCTPVLLVVCQHDRALVHPQPVLDHGSAPHSHPPAVAPRCLRPTFSLPLPHPLSLSSGVSITQSNTSSLRSDAIKLTSSGASNVGANAWLTSPFRFTDFFHATFSYLVANPQNPNPNLQAEGFAFILLDPTAQLSSSQGTGSVNLAYNLAQAYSLAVEFDMHYDGVNYDPSPAGGATSPTSATDYACNHVEVHGSLTGKGNGPAVSQRLYPASSTSQPAWLASHALVNGAHVVDIEYQAGYSSSGGLLSVWIDSALILQYGLSDTAVSSMFANNTAYFGFSASTGTDSVTGAAISADLFIYNISVFTNLASPQYTQVTLNAGSTAAVTASATAPAMSSPATAALNLRAFDYCNRPFAISAGLFTPALMMTGSRVGNAMVVDWTNGNYSLYTWYTAASTAYSLSLTTNTQPLVNSPYPLTILAGPVSAATTTYTTSAPLQSLTAGTPLSCVVTVRDAYGNPNSTSNLGAYDLSLTINNPGTDTTDYLYPTSNSGANYTFSVVTTASSRLGASGSLILGAMYLTLLSSNVVNSPVTNVLVSEAAVSGVNCSLSGNLISITAGTLAQVVLQPLDVYGNPIRGVLNGSLVLTGKTTAAMVTATPQWLQSTASSTYPTVLFTFTPTIADTYRIAALVGASAASLQSVPDSHTPTVIASTAVNASRSSFYGLANGTAGYSASNPGVTFTLQSRDAWGNNITTANGNAYTYTVTAYTAGVANLTATCVDSGNPTPMADVTGVYGQLTCAYSQSSSTYSVKLAAYNASLTYAVAVSMNGQPVPVQQPSSSTFTVAAAAAAPSQSTFALLTTSLSAGSTGYLRVWVSDVYGNARVGVNDTAVLWNTPISFISSSTTGSVQLSSWGMNTSLDGSYLQAFTPITATAYSVSVQIAGISLAISTGVNQVTVTPGAFVPARLQVQGSGVAGGVTGSNQTFTLVPYDGWGNQLQKAVSANLTLLVNVSTAVLWTTGQVTYTADSTPYQSYGVTYTVPPFVVNASALSISVYNGSYQGVLCTTLLGQVLVPATDNATANLSSSSVAAGSVNSVEVTPRNVLGPVYNEDEFALTLLNSSTNASIPLNLPAPVCVTSDSDGCGLWRFTLNPTQAGVYRLQVLVSTTQGTSETIQSTAGIGPVVVYPAAVSAARSTLTAVTSTSLPAGTSFTFRVRCVDAYNNPWSTSPGIAITVASSAYPAESPVAAPTITDTHDGAYTVTLAYTKAGTRTLTVTLGGTVMAATLLLTYTASTFNGATSSFIIPSTQAGTAVQVTLTAADGYSNALTTALVCAATFVRGWDGAVSTFSATGGSTGANFLTTAAQGQGQYQLSLSALSLADYSAPLSVSLACGAASASTAIPSAVNVTVNPAALSDRLSAISNWPASPLVSASTLVLALSLSDPYGNPWGPTSGATPRALFSATIPRNTLLNVMSVPGSFIPLSTSIGSGLYTVTYQPNLASSSYTFVFIDDVNVQHTFNRTTFTVVAQPTPAAARTTLTPSPLSQSMVAGVVQTVVVQFADAYGNPITPTLLNSSLNANGALSPSPILISFYQRNPTSYCVSGAIDTSQSASSLFNTTGLTLTPDASSIVVNFTTAKVGTYFLMVTVAGTPILTSCSALPARLGFAVVHAPVYLPASLVSLGGGSALRAGAALSLTIQLVDAFNNSISDLATSTVLAPPSTSFTSLCTSTLPVFPWSPSSDAISAPVAGAFTVSFTATSAGTYVLPFTLGGLLVGSSDSCPTLTILPSYMYSFSRGVEGTVVAGVQSSFTLAGVDVYGNAISAANLVGGFTASFTYQGSGTQPPFTFTSVSSLSASVSAPVVSYYADLAGNYSVTVSIPADSSDPSHHVPAPLTYIVTVQPQSCAAQTSSATQQYRCPADGSCVTSYSHCADFVSCPLGSFVNDTGDSVCLSSYPTPDLCPAGTSLCALPSTSAQSAYLLSANAVNFFCAVACPTSWLSGRYPVDCGNGVARLSLSDCPSSQVCPFGYSTCPDGSCITAGSNCSFSATTLALGTACAASGGVQCRDGRCVQRAENCGTARTCGQQQVLCSDGSCQQSTDLCPNSYSCALASQPYLCSSGECRSSAADCPSPRVCPVSQVLCPGGECAATASKCNQNGTVCGVELVRCGDGSCRSNSLQCPTIITCPALTPVHCPDNSCAGDIALCPALPACASPTPFICPDGSCATNGTGCASGITCPPAAPVLCADHSCAASLSSCGLTFTCPPAAPIRCSDGACKGSTTDCSSTLTCPSSIPVRCPDGSCAISVLACPSPPTQLNCSANMVRCPSGHCALAITDCPTTVSCGSSLSRCADGSCRPACPVSLALTAYSFCSAGQVLCPRTSAGVACAPSLAQCPTEMTCPTSRPVRCVDSSCAASSADCPVVTSLITDQYLTSPCVGGGWKDGLGSCGTSVTCPAFAPVKCWDESCRVTADDCPAQVACTFGTTNAPSFLCPDGSCHSTPSACSSLIQCTYPQVKCPSDTAGGAGVFCVNDVSQCVNLYQATNPTAVCPNSYTRCRNGNCMPSVQSCGAFQCPAQLPYLCPAGVCAVSNATCPNTNGCPADSGVKCWDGSCTSSILLCPATQTCQSTGQTRCADGSCTSGKCYSPDATGCPSGQVRCWDKTCASAYSDCTAASDAYNACPASRPYRCGDGYCAVTKSACPLFPLVPASSSCSTARPVLCAEGSCVAFASQCPVVRPCAVGTTRCGDGSCRISAACPTLNTCPSSRPLRCQSGLCVAAAVTALSTFLESATSSDPNCIDEATRDGLTSGVQDSRGCPYGLQKCIDGSCSSRCTATTAGLGVASLTSFMFPNAANGCPSSTPLKCYDGSCAAQSGDCQATTGCPAARPVLCGDGSCQATQAACSNATSCTAAAPVQCANGQCAATYAQCQAANNCPVSHPLRCANGQCAAYPAHAGAGTEQSLNTSSLSVPLLTTTCSPTVTCDAQQAFQCADLTCVASPDKCRPLQPCPASTPRYCTFSATCIAAGQQCAQQNSSFCPAASPVLCSNGACVTSTRKCVSPYAPLLSSAVSACTAPLVQCFDGSCTSSYSSCYQKASLTHFTASFDINASVMNSTCAAVAQFPCANGLCLWSQSAAAVSMCDAVPACTAAYPVRCGDGRCVAESAASSCGVLATCEGGAVRCGDGSCRPSASLCVPVNGCPASLPFFCPGASTQCVLSSSQCSATALLADAHPSSRRLLQTTVAVAGSQVCAENCDRDRVASHQDVSVALQRQTTVDVSVDSAHVVRTQIVIAAGALAPAVSVFSVTPVATSALTSATTPFASTILSSPFACSTDQPTLAFVANLTVNAAVDLQLPSGSSSVASASTTTSSTVTPCALTTGTGAAFGASAYAYGGENSTCTGSLQLTTTGISLQWTSGCTSPDRGLALTGMLTSIASSSYAAGFTAGYGATCLCYNVTTTSSSSYPAGSQWCMFASHASSSSAYIAAWSISSASTRCPGPLESAASNHFLQLSPPASLALSCTSSTSDIDAISASDICLGRFDAATATWACVFPDYAYRSANPPWTTTTGRATNRMQSLLPSCSAAAYAFMYSPLVAPVGPPGPTCSIWCQYEALILGLSIGITCFLVVSAYIIWRLIRYRRKYLANKKENEALSARARHLDEYAGGLGLADEEVDMVGNPLVIEMKALDDRIARMSKGGNMDLEGEQQVRLIREMEEEKKRLYAQLLQLREQVKAKQTAQGPKGPSRASIYLRQQVNPFVPVRLSFGGEGLGGARRGSSEGTGDDTQHAHGIELMTEDGGTRGVERVDGGADVVAVGGAVPAGAMEGQSGSADGVMDRTGNYGSNGEVAEHVEAIAVAMPEEVHSREEFGPNNGGGKKKLDL